MTNITIIASIEELEQACEVMASQPWLAMDTEFMRERTYAPILCLIQVGGPADNWCIDPLAIEHMGAFSNVLGDRKQTKVLHSCRQDLEAFDTRFEQTVGRLFDTQIAAAFLRYGEQVSYAALVEQTTGVKLAKSHTRADWQARPLSNAELEYAMDDVRYLQPVHQRMAEELDQRGRMQWFIEECERQLEPDIWRMNPETAWCRLKGAANLPIAAQATARALAIWRETHAIERNKPREWVLPTGVLLAVSKSNPAEKFMLDGIPGMHKGVIRNSGATILEICKSTRRDPDAEPLWRDPRTLTPDQRQQIKQIMKRIRDVAEEIGLSPALLSNRQSVENLVSGNQDILLLKGWRREVVGDQILQDFI